MQKNLHNIENVFKVCYNTNVSRNLKGVTMVEYGIVRLTSDDYREFRRIYSKLVYSIYDKASMLYFLENKITRQALEKEMRTRSKFINDLESQDRVMYFFKRDEEIIGFFELSFHKGKCDIVEFFVAERYRGYGTIMWEKALDVARERKPSRIELWTPYIGAQIFWSKMGFETVYINGVKCYRKKMRYS